jgi:uncharacterized protein with HEPN domain
VNRDKVYLLHIRDALAKIESYVAIGYDRFMADSHWQDAVIRQLEIVGEATKKLSPELKLRFPSVPWRQISGLRDVLIHDYMGVDLNAIWEITRQNLPELKSVIEIILNNIDD